MTIPDKIALVANVVEIAVGALALYIAIAQRHKISIAFTTLLNHTFNSSLSDFKHWLQKLEENGTEPGNSREARIALAYLVGKIKGNKILHRHFGDKMLKRLKVMIEDLDDGNVIVETSKVTLCSEIRESLATLEVENYKEHK